MATKAKGLSDNAKAIFYAVKDAADNGKYITSKGIAEVTGLSPRSITGTLNFTFCKEGGAYQCMKREEVTVEGEEKPVKVIVLTNPDFDPDAVPNSEE